jgi:hypothetical protein
VIVAPDRQRGWITRQDRPADPVMR